MKDLYYSFLRFWHFTFSYADLKLLPLKYGDEDLGDLVFGKLGEYQYLGKGAPWHYYLPVNVEIEIVKCSNSRSWHRDHIGATFKYERDFPHTETHIVLMRDRFFKHHYYLAPREDCKLSIS